MMKRHLLWIPGLALCAVCTAPAQNVISARSGLVHYVEGRVYVAGKVVETSVANFPEVKEDQVLRTEAGRAEVLLGPGVFLRIGENSSFRMIANRLIDTRLEHLTGSILIECVDLPKGSNLTVVSRETTVSLLTKGLYRFDSNPARLRVFEGAALAEAGGRKVELRKGKLVSLDGNLVAGKFDPKVTDDLFLWSQRRSQYIAMANVSAANSLQGSSLYASAWQWNPFFGMFTFIPYGGADYSPFGYRYWSPVTSPGAYPVRHPSRPPAPVTSPVTKRPPKQPRPSPVRPVPARSGAGISRSGSSRSSGGGISRSGGGSSGGSGRSGGSGGSRSSGGWSGGGGGSRSGGGWSGGGGGGGWSGGGGGGASGGGGGRSGGGGGHR